MREPLDIFYLKMAYFIAERSTCVRRKVGAVLVKDRMVLSSGYNGAPKNVEHCTPETCIRTQLSIPSGERQEMCIGAHAEMNAIAQASYNGICTKDATIYCTTQPCLYCSKAIINAGIKRIVYCEGYGTGMDELTQKILSNIEVVRIDKSLLEK